MQDIPALTGLTLYHAIRASYPRPSHEAGAQNYCVGGALLKFFDSQASGPAFPSQRRLMRLLEKANPGLSEILALLYSGSIIRRNDQQDFEGAWKQLRLALTHHEETASNLEPQRLVN